jgi:hypothetical protein
MAVAAGFAVAACGVAEPTPAQLDANFVALVRAEGRTVPSGGDGEATLVAAARKICDRQANHDTVADRRANRLTQHELEAVARTFADDARRFTALALQTYCPS